MRTHIHVYVYKTFHVYMEISIYIFQKIRNSVIVKRFVLVTTLKVSPAYDTYVEVSPSG